MKYGIITTDADPLPKIYLKLEQESVGGEVRVVAYSSTKERLGVLVAFDVHGRLYRSVDCPRDDLSEAGLKLDCDGRITVKT